MQLHRFLHEIIVFNKNLEDFGPWSFDDFDRFFCKVFLGTEISRFRRIVFDVGGKGIKFFLIILGRIIEKVFPFVRFWLIFLGFGVGISERVVD